MAGRRLKVIFRETIDLETVNLFAVALENFGHTYRTHDDRTVFVMPDAERAAVLELQLAEWEKEGAINSWDYAT